MQYITIANINNLCVLYNGFHFLSCSNKILVSSAKFKSLKISVNAKWTFAFVNKLKSLPKYILWTKHKKIKLKANKVMNILK